MNKQQALVLKDQIDRDIATLSLPVHTDGVRYNRHGWEVRILLAGHEDGFRVTSWESWQNWKACFQGKFVKQEVTS